METKVQHQTPWGAWEVLDDADSHKVKKVTIKKSFLNEFKLNGSDNAVRKSK